MARMVICLLLSLALAACGIFLLCNSLLSPNPLTMQVFLLILAVFQILVGIASGYVIVRFEMLAAESLRLRHTEVPNFFQQEDSVHRGAASAAQGFLNDRGWDGLKDVQARLDQGLTHYFVGLEQLAGYNEQCDPHSILLGGNRVVFPVTVDGEVRIGIAVTEEANGWRFSEAGFSRLAGSLFTARQQALADHPKAHSFAFVDAPAMNHHFLAFKVGDSAYLTCLSDWQSSPLKFMETLPASTALAKLQPQAAEKLQHYKSSGEDLLGG